MAAVLPGLALIAPASAMADSSSAVGETAAAVTGETSLASSIDALCEHAPRGVFRDVSGVHAANIDCLSGFEVTVGVGGGNFAPASSVRRAQMASFLVNFAEVATSEEPADNPGVARFEDVAGSVHKNNIAVAASMGITSGTTATTFSPGLRVTREQMASFVVNAVEAVGADLPPRPFGAASPFGDVIAGVHVDSIARLADVGIVAGVGDGRFEPMREVSRSQMATFLMNAAAYLHEQDAWVHGALSADVPRLLHVARDGAALDVVRLLWGRDVDVVGDVSDVEVFNGSASALSRGRSHAKVGGDTTRIELAEALVAGQEYRLHIPAGFVHDAEGAENLAQTVEFTFLAPEDGSGDAGGGAGGDVGDGAGGDAGGDGAGGDTPTPTDVVVSSVSVDGERVEDGGTAGTAADNVVVTGVTTAVGSIVDGVEVRAAGGPWELADASSGGFDSDIEPFSFDVTGLTDGRYDVEVRASNDVGDVSDIWTVELVVEIPVEVTIESVVTDPAADSLVVTFSEPVTCPDTQAARDAWDFVNDSRLATQNIMGSPDSVHSDGSSACRLTYSRNGIRDGDFGTIDYAQPGDLEDSVSNEAQTKLSSISQVDVKDGVDPVYESMAAIAGEAAINLKFSEPIACSTVGLSDFNVTFGSQSVEIVDFECTNKSSDTVALNMEYAPDEGALVSAEIPEGAVVSDASLDNNIATPTTKSAFA